MNITHLLHSEIDKQRWDKALNKCVNKQIYANSWYLDSVSPQWQAFVADDYSALFPLPTKSKLGFTYVVQPKFTTQLGLFSHKAMEVDGFVGELKSRFRRFNLNLNHENSLPAGAKSIINMELMLNKPYEELSAAYNKNTKRNIKKAKLMTFSDWDIESYLECKLAENPDAKEEEFQVLRSLLTSCKANATDFIIIKAQKSKALAAAVFAEYGGRLVYMNGVSNAPAKESSAMFAIIDRFIRKYSDSSLVIDFRGGQMQGTRRFFSGWNAQEVIYSNISRVL